MFWFLHYAVKVGIAVAFLALGGALYANRHLLAPADEWARTLRRTQTEVLPVVGQVTGRVVRASSGDTLVVRVEDGRPIPWRVAGILGPPRRGRCAPRGRLRSSPAVRRCGNGRAPAR